MQAVPDVRRRRQLLLLNIAFDREAGSYGASGDNTPCSRLAELEEQRRRRSLLTHPTLTQYFLSKYDVLIVHGLRTSTADVLDIHPYEDRRARSVGQKLAEAYHSVRVRQQSRRGRTAERAPVVYDISYKWTTCSAHVQRPLLATVGATLCRSGRDDRSHRQEHSADGRFHGRSSIRERDSGLLRHSACVCPTSVRQGRLGRVYRRVGYLFEPVLGTCRPMSAMYTDRQPCYRESAADVFRSLHSGTI